MKKRNKSLLFLIAICGIAACASSQKTEESGSLSVKKVEQISLGATPDDVVKAVGLPRRKVENESEGASGWLYYISSTNHQNAFFSFDKQTNSLNYKFVVPQENEDEYSIQFLLNRKFKNIGFERVDYPQCGRDHIRDEGLYANISNGIVIGYYKSSDVVEFITWTTPDKVKMEIQKALECKKGGV